MALSASSFSLMSSLRHRCLGLGGVSLGVSASASASASASGLLGLLRGGAAALAFGPLTPCGFGPMQVRTTTVLCVRKHDKVVLAADGQCTAGNEVVKHNVRKLRRIETSLTKRATQSVAPLTSAQKPSSKDAVVGGFAGATADAFTLFERLEHRLDEYPGQLTRAAVELAKDWRTDKFLRRLDATLIVADKSVTLQVTGNGDVIDPPQGVCAIGSGGSYALAAARALIDREDLDAEQVARRAMEIAADIDIYTNNSFLFEIIDCSASEGDDDTPSETAAAGVPSK